MQDDDLCYHPPGQGLEWIRSSGPHRVLIRGDLASGDSALIEGLDADVRQLPPGSRSDPLHDGVYGALRRGRWEALVVSGELPQLAPARARHRFTDDGANRHLGTARVALTDEWEDGRPFAGTSPFSPDDVVKVLGNGRIGKVLRIVRTESGHRIDVTVDGETHAASAESLERINGDPRDPTFWVQESPASAADIALTLTWTKIRQPLTNTLYAYKASKTLFRPYQFLPALKILSSPTGRLLIADEVGLGKTIEAGIVWSELEQRSTMRRTLVVAPSSLGLKWRMEMGRRFDRELEIIKPSRLAELGHDLLEGKDPELHAIISIESLRSAQGVLEQLSEMKPRFDLVIVDEAHALRNTGTRSNILGGLLSDWADHLLFLSATPINLRSDDLYNLLNLLDEGLYQDSDVFQLQLEPNRHLNEVGRRIAIGEPASAVRSHLRAIRELELGSTVAARPDFTRLEALLAEDGPLGHAQRSEVKSLVAELNTLSGVLARTRKVDVPDAKAVREPHSIAVQWNAEEKAFYELVVASILNRALETGTPPGFAMQMPLRQAASCLPAMQRQLRRHNTESFERTIDDVDEEISADGASSLDGLPALSRLPLLTSDSKYEALLERLLHLRRQGLNQAMIFSTFRGTIAYLVERLSQHFRVRYLHGGVPMQDRQPIIDDFRGGEFELLIASEVASEGLDFEFCNVLVNYDLPWNPMRVEQRIGRLDRFGQRHEKILILNMHVPGTIESDILERLYWRIGIFRDSIGDLEPILRDEFHDITRRLLDPSLTAEQRHRRADEIAIAIENRAGTLKRLDEERAALSTVEQLTVEGLTASGPTEGRYVGAAEIFGVVSSMMSATKGSLSRGTPDGMYVLRGTPELSDLIWAYHGPQRGARQSAIPFQAKLRHGDPIDVTFDAELASIRDVELLSVRHPLVELAIDHLESDPLRLRRYGCAETPDLPAGERFAVSVDLVEQSGIRPARELWATAVNVRTGEAAPEAGPAVLSSLASGSLREMSWGEPVDMRRWLAPLRTAAWARREDEEPRRRLDNEAMAAGRLEAREASTRIKLDKARATLKRVQLDMRDARIIRMHEGRIRNLEQDLDRLRADHLRQREFSLTLRTVAILEVAGPRAI